MRAVFSMVTALVVLGSPAAAQAGIEVAIKGGVSFGDVSNKGLLPGSLETRTGGAAGAGIVTKGLVGIGVEGLIAQRGVKSATATAERKLDYVDVPAYLRVALPTTGFKPFAYAGPQVSFELRCRAGNADCADDGRSKTTYAGVIGAGVRVGGITGFLIEARYVYGLNDLKLSTVTSEASYKTRSFLILAGLTF